MEREEGRMSVSDDSRASLFARQPEVGERFVFSAPAAEESAGGGGAVRSEPRRAIVLIVDDEPLIGAMLSRALRGHDVTIVSNVKDAVAQLDAGREFDVILSDLMMPVASGMDLYDLLTRRFPKAAERMVFISGGAFTPITQAFLDRVPNERIEKPFRVTEVQSLVERFVRPS